MKRIAITVGALGSALAACAQEVPQLKVTGYIETYYGYDFNRPDKNDRPSFIYSHNKHNELNLNLGYIKASYETLQLRANLAIMAGTYTNANLAAEPGVLKNIYEANAGVKLSKSTNLWFDAGIFASHIGFESAVSKDCWVLTRNLSSENTPYYEAGAKLSYATANGKLKATLLYLNGWQRIARQANNAAAAGGLQFTYQPTPKLTFNYSNYVGTEGADALRVRRIYHNFYAIAQFTKSFGLTAGVDYGTQQKAKGQSATYKVLSPVLIAQYRFDPKWAIAGRAEYYQDKAGVFIATGTPNGFKTKGYSLNLDYAPITNALLRIEAKVYDSKDKVFLRNALPINHNATITASMAVAF